MDRPTQRLRASVRSAQRGQAIIFTAVLIALGVFAAVYTTVSSTSAAIASKQAADTTKALAEVKSALIAWSAARTPPDTTSQIRPGELPCPANNTDGNDPGGCSAGAIGRVPWKSLGIPEPKDGSGETLWYAISGPFRYYGAGNTAPITSDTLGTLTVYHGSSATTLTSQAVAVIFAPGASLGAQDRSSTTTASCTTTGTVIARNLCATNYLESTGGGNNAQTGGPFIHAALSSTFNDRALAITNEDLMPLVEQRVAREMMSILESYKNATGVYPWADLGDGNSNGSGSYFYNRNRFPCGTALPTSWAGAGITLPNWLTNGCSTVTGWAGVIYYTASKNRLQASGNNCTTCDQTRLDVKNSGAADLCRTGVTPFVCTPTTVSSGDADLVLITPGGATSTRGTSLWSDSSWSTISSLYFSDSDNRGNDDDDYRIPSSTTGYNRNRIYIVR